MQLNQEIIDNAKDTLKSQLRIEKQLQLSTYENDLKDMEKQLLEEVEKEFYQTCASYNEDLDKLKIQLEEYQQKRNAINEEILRQRAINEQRDFYRICIPSDDLADIKYLLSIMSSIRNREILAKLIWSEYLQNPFKKMLKNVLNGKEIKNAIYKITNIDTGEIYIGKTSGLVSNRWTEHIKTSLNIGTIKSANIHKALYGAWDHFTFEVLQVVSENEKLGDYEKYWINFYQSITYGYNMKSGG